MFHIQGHQTKKIAESVCPVDCEELSGSDTIDGADPPRRDTGAAECNPLFVRGFAPAIQRMRWMGGKASKLAHPPAPYKGSRYLERAMKKHGSDR